MKNSINLRQMACIAGTLVFANKVLVLPSLLFDDIGVDGIFCLIFMFSIDILLLWAFFKVKKTFPTATFFEILSKIFTKYGAYIIYFCLMIFFFFKAVLVYTVTLMYLKNQVYFDAVEYVFLICFLTITNQLTFSGLRTASRTLEFFYSFIMLLIFLCAYTTATNFNGFPVFFNTPILDIGKISFKNIFAFGDVIFFFVIMDRIDLTKGKKRTVFFYAIFNMLIVLLLYGVFFSVFKYTGFMHNNAASDVITYSNKFVNFGRIDIIAVIVITMLNYFQLGIYSKGCDYTFCSIFKTKNRIYSIVIFDIFFVLAIFVFIADYTVALNIARTIIPYISIVLQYAVPILCFVFALCQKKGRKYDKVF